jgi:hypothetical protein
MEKLIIENRTNIPIKDLLGHIKAVIDMGRISNDNKQYCYMVSFDTPERIAISSDLNKNSDRLIIWKDRANYYDQETSK